MAAPARSKKKKLLALTHPQHAAVAVVGAVACGRVGDAVLLGSVGCTDGLNEFAAVRRHVLLPSLEGGQRPTSQTVRANTSARKGTALRLLLGDVCRQNERRHRRQLMVGDYAVVAAGARRKTGGWRQSEQGVPAGSKECWGGTLLLMQIDFVVAAVHMKENPEKAPRSRCFAAACLG